MIRPDYLALPFADLTTAEMCLRFMIHGAPDQTSVDHLREACQKHLEQPDRANYAEVEVTIFAIFLTAKWYSLGDVLFSDRTVQPCVYDVKVTLR